MLQEQVCSGHLRRRVRYIEHSPALCVSRRDDADKKQADLSDPKVLWLFALDNNYPSDLESVEPLGVVGMCVVFQRRE